MHGSKEVGSLLKAAVKHSLELIGVTEASKQTRLDAGTLSRAGNPQYGNHLPIDDAVRLDRIANDPVVTREMAHLLGYELVPLVARRIDGNVNIVAGEIAGRAGDLVRETAHDAADGVLSQNEINQIDRKRMNLVSAVNGLGEIIHAEK